MKMFILLARWFSRLPLEVVIPLAFMAAGLVMLLIRGGDLWRGYASSSWPATQGVITQAEIVEAEDSEGDPVYQAAITYRYDVGGRLYSGSAITAMDESTSLRVFADKALARYPAGSEVTVHYQPDDPATAVLEPGLRGGMLIYTGVIAWCLLGGLGALIFAPRWLVHRRAEAASLENMGGAS